MHVNQTIGILLHCTNNYALPIQISDSYFCPTLLFENKKGSTMIYILSTIQPISCYKNFTIIMIVVLVAIISHLRYAHLHFLYIFTSYYIVYISFIYAYIKTSLPYIIHSHLYFHHYSDKEIVIESCYRLFFLLKYGYYYAVYMIPPDMKW